MIRSYLGDTKLTRTLALIDFAAVALLAASVVVLFAASAGWAVIMFIVAAIASQATEIMRRVDRSRRYNEAVDIAVAKGKR